MQDLLVAVLSLILGVLIALWVFSLFRKYKSKELTQTQSVILMEKIKTVCKLITVEGEFAEIYHHENIKQRLMGLVNSRKKALIVINAKAHIGYDLSKLDIEADDARRTIRLKHMPQPEVLSIEPDLKYYDIKDGLFNKFAPEDLTVLNQEAKKHIMDKIPESGLMETAKKEALEAILIMKNIVETIGWNLDYSALEIENNSKEPKSISNE
ncbi:DUF4230 domain-containing protein [Mangrovimonas aestuarii]|uniref:DUF4230 domain-containing protein n=1 Tax=Mangrovimonas aestuarii TaxID=3018443 RepID=UPI002378B276|nr:DUF4230 domain-containing protein [Mangrovimonas aestuarii]